MLPLCAIRRSTMEPRRYSIVALAQWFAYDDFGNVVSPRIIQDGICDVLAWHGERLAAEFFGQLEDAVPPALRRVCGWRALPGVST